MPSASAELPFPQGCQVSIIANFDMGVEPALEVRSEGQVHPFGDIGSLKNYALEWIKGSWRSDCQSLHATLIGVNRSDQFVQPVQDVSRRIAGGNAPDFKGFVLLIMIASSSHLSAADIHGNVIFHIGKYSIINLKARAQRGITSGLSLLRFIKIG
jgi:hypothetical protein